MSKKDYINTPLFSLFITLFFCVNEGYGQLSTGVIQNQNLIINRKNKPGYSNYTCLYSLDDSSRKVVFTPIVNNKDYKWILEESKTILCSNAFGQNPREKDVYLYEYELPYFDSLELKPRRLAIIDSLSILLGNKKKADIRLMNIKAKKRNRKIVNPLWFLNHVRAKKNNLRNIPLFYDILHTESSSYQLFVSFNKEFSIWSFRYPSPEENLPLQDWKELVTYTADTIAFEYPFIHKRLILPNGHDQHRFQSISDSLFFQGDFRIIRQKGELYCINTDHGGIYHIGECIEKVAQIENIKNYPEWLFGKAYFIEDRDRETLIFLQLVKVLSTKTKTPKIEVLDRKSFNERFGHLNQKRK